MKDNYILVDELNEYDRMLKIVMRILKNNLEEDDKIENIECKMHKDVYEDGDGEDKEINYHLECIAIVKSKYVPKETIISKEYFDKPCYNCIPKYRAKIEMNGIDNETMKVNIDVEDGYDPEEYYDDEAERRQIEWLKESGHWY